MIRFVLALSLLLLSAPPVAAQENLRHPELQKFEKDGGTVDFLGHAYGLDGWLLVRKGQQPMAVYTTRDGGLVQGMLVNPEGEVETMRQLLALKGRMEGDQRAMQDVDLSRAPKSERFYAEVEKAPWAEVGDPSAPYIYMFINTTCRDCQLAFRAFEPAVKAGQLRLRIAPFGTLPDNRDGGAALLSSEKPDESWAAFIAGDVTALSASKIVDGAREAVDANTALLRKYNINGTPFIIYRRMTDGVVTALVGKPENPMLLLSDLIKPDRPASLPGLDAPIENKAGGGKE